MPVDLRQISFYPAKRQYILSDSEPGLEIIQSGSGAYLVCRPTGGGTPVFQITNAGVIQSAAGIAEFSTLQSVTGEVLVLNASGSTQSGIRSASYRTTSSHCLNVQCDLVTIAAMWIPFKFYTR